MENPQVSSRNRSTGKSAPIPAPASKDPLASYVANLSRMRSKLDLIVANSQASVESLQRVAAALRSIPGRK